VGVLCHQPIKTFLSILRVAISLPGYANVATRSRCAAQQRSKRAAHFAAESSARSPSRRGSTPHSGFARQTQRASTASDPPLTPRAGPCCSYQTGRRKHRCNQHRKSGIERSSPRMLRQTSDRRTVAFTEIRGRIRSIVCPTRSQKFTVNFASSVMLLRLV
jgi:hypothetical protein